MSTLRQAADEAALAWRRAGGYLPVGGSPLQPEMYAKVRDARDAYYAAAAECYPTDLNELLRSVRDGQPPAIEEAISWLEADYFTRWTGYMKQRIMYALCQSPLTDADKDRLRHVVLAVCTRGQRQEFREVLRLSRRQLASPVFAAQLLHLANTVEADVARAAALMVRAALASTE